eukprot:jgi/Botrbrau1/13971/Bobra.117_2s0001.1
MDPEHLAQKLGNWVLENDELAIKREIGRGSFGCVALGCWRDTDVAIKMLEEGSSLQSKKKMAVLRTALEKEASILMSIRHPNIVLFMGLCLEPLQLVTEFCPRGSLSDCLQKARSNATFAAALSWPRRLSMALDAAKGMSFLHGSRPPVLHRDLKSPNILVDKHWRCKIADFGLSKIMDTLELDATASISAENPRWLAPEVLEHGRLSAAADVYAFGVVMWELLTWSVPWEDEKPFQVIMAVVQRKEELEVPEDLSELPGGTFDGIQSYIDLIRRCCTRNPEDRPTFGRVVRALRGIMDTCVSEHAAKSIQQHDSCSAVEAPAGSRRRSSDSLEPENNAALSLRRVSAPIGVQLVQRQKKFVSWRGFLPRHQPAVRPKNEQPQFRTLAMQPHPCSPIWQQEAATVRRQPRGTRRPKPQEPSRIMRHPRQQRAWT